MEQQQQQGKVLIGTRVRSCASFGSESVLRLAYAHVHELSTILGEGGNGCRFVTEPQHSSLIGLIFLILLAVYCMRY